MQALKLDPEATSLLLEVWNKNTVADDFIAQTEVCNSAVQYALFDSTDLVCGLDDQVKFSECDFSTKSRTKKQWYKLNTGGMLQCSLYCPLPGF